MECEFLIQYNYINSNTYELSDKGILLFLQEMAGRHSSALGYGLLDISKTHIAWIILNWRIKMFSRPRYCEKIFIKTWPRKIAKSFYFRDFEIYNNNHEKIGIASSKWVAVDTQSHSMILNDSDIQNKFTPIEKSVFEDEIKKINIPEFTQSEITYTVSRRDIDTNNHVNNIVYLSLAYEVLPEEIYNNLNYNNLEIMYKSEAKLGDKLNIEYKPISENEFIVVISTKETNTLHCVIRYF